MLINKRLPFGVVVIAFAVLTMTTAAWVARDADDREGSVVGAGRIGRPIADETTASASDFGFAVDDHGGTFVCSMAGPETGGFAGFRVMLVEGPVSRGSLEIHERDISFSGFATVAPIPDLNDANQTVLDGVPYSVTERARGMRSVRE